MDRALIVGPGKVQDFLYVYFWVGLYLDSISFGSRQDFYARLGEGVCLFVDIVLGPVGVFSRMGIGYGFAGSSFWDYGFFFLGQASP